MVLYFAIVRDMDDANLYDRSWFSAISPVVSTPITVWPAIAIPLSPAFGELDRSTGFRSPPVLDAALTESITKN